MRYKRFDETYQYLLELINRPDSALLPSVRKLAVSCGVSLATSAKVVATLKREGKIVSVPGVGLWNAAAYHGYTRKKKPAGMVKSVQVMRSMEQDIVSGTYTPGGRLPTVKELVNTYNVSFPTLKKALNAMHAQGILQRERGSYVVPSKRANYRKKLIMIRSGYKPVQLTGEHGRIDELERELGMECVRVGLSLEIVAYDHKKLRFFSYESGSHSYMSADDAVLGYVFVLQGIEDLDAFIGKFICHGKPISLFVDQPVSEEYKANASKLGDIRFFNVGYSEKAGAIMGDYLREHGYTQIAYFSPFHGDSWSIMRLRGLTTAFSGFSSLHLVVPFVIDTHRSTWDYVKAVKRKRATTIEQFRRAIGPWDEQRLALENVFVKQLTSEEIMEHLLPFALDALSRKEIEAWVGANDSCALLLQDYLEKKQPEALKRIRVIGFDDTFQSLQRNMVSFDFNIPGIAHAMVLHILNPRDPLFGNSYDITIEGRVMERGLSTRK